MSIDLEHELKQAMDDFTADVLAPPDMLSRLGRTRRRRAFPRLAVGLAATAAAATIAGVVIVGAHTGGDTAGAVAPLSTYHPPADSGQREEQAARAMTAAIDSWGPTRGDRSDDTALMSRLRAEWSHPTQHPPHLGSFEPVQSPDGPVRILWVGSTPDGAAALAAQHTHDPVSDYWYGIFLPSKDGRPVLAQRGQLLAGVDLGEFDPHVLSFTSSTGHDAVVALPMDASDTVRFAFSTVMSASGRLTPQWQDAAVQDGAAVASVPSSGNVWGTVVEVAHGGAVVADHRLDFVATHLVNEGPTEPVNLLGLWCNGCAVGHSAGVGYTKAMIDAWLVRHGPDYLPSYNGTWSIGTTLRDGSNVLATQLWTVGSKARTVVLVDDRENSSIDVLYDAQTDPAERPLVALRLPQADGWLVGAGPDAVITAWRASTDDAWHPVGSKKAALLPTDAGSVQLRLIVHGKETVVTR
jgi:hypothetical protein